eukprot:6198307-Pleurochrysis_carterae.AAC.1
MLWPTVLERCGRVRVRVGACMLAKGRMRGARVRLLGAWAAMRYMRAYANIRIEALAARRGVEWKRTAAADKRGRRASVEAQGVEQWSWSSARAGRRG